jgi:bifunctional DNA primase/polymerase-like protein
METPMVEAGLRRSRRGDAGRMAAAAAGYAALGWPVCPGAWMRAGGSRGRRQGLATGEPGRACSCDRVGCPAPGAHPLSPAWQLEASTDPAETARWWRERPEANIILVTGRLFDVLDVPAAAGHLALGALTRARAVPGPVAFTVEGRALFFVATRGKPDDEAEWWSCQLDCEPDSFAPVAGLRWHCRASYVVGPPSRAGRGAATHWVREPAGHPLPDALRLIEFLADACDEVMR